VRRTEEEIVRIPLPHPAAYSPHVEGLELSGLTRASDRTGVKSEWKGVTVDAIKEGSGLEEHP